MSPNDLAKQLFLYRTSTNVPLPDDFWERQHATMRQPFLTEAAEILSHFAAEAEVIEAAEAFVNWMDDDQHSRTELENKLGAAVDRLRGTPQP